MMVKMKTRQRFLSVSVGQAASLVMYKVVAEANKEAVQQLKLCFIHIKMYKNKIKISF